MKSKSQRASNKKLRLKKRAYVQDYKLRHGCVRCGFDLSAVALDLHHVRETEIPKTRRKRADWCNLGWPTILAELAKCVVLCKNCHMMLHFDEENF